MMADFLVNAGIKPESIVSYNHLGYFFLMIVKYFSIGNNDGKNLSS